MEFEWRARDSHNDQLLQVNCYTPNSGEGLKRLGYRVEKWDKGDGGLGGGRSWLASQLPAFVMTSCLSLVLGSSWQTSLPT